MSWVYRESHDWCGIRRNDPFNYILTVVQGIRRVHVKCKSGRRGDVYKYKDGWREERSRPGWSFILCFFFGVCIFIHSLADHSSRIHLCFNQLDQCILFSIFSLSLIFGPLDSFGSSSQKKGLLRPRCPTLSADRRGRSLWGGLFLLSFNASSCIVWLGGTYPSLLPTLSACLGR